MTHLASILKSRDLTLLTKVLYSLKLFSSLVQMWEVDYKEGWVLKYWCFQSVVLEKTDWVKPVSPKRNQPWIFIGRTDAEAEAPTLWPPDAKSQLTGKDPDAGKDWRQKEKGPAEDKMVGRHHWLSGHEFEQTLGDSGGETSLACWSPWGCKESGTTEWLNTTMKVLKTTWYPFIPL